MTNRLISAKVARERCGGKSNITLYRWIHDENLGFPRPVYINGRRYFVESEIASFIDAQTAGRIRPGAMTDKLNNKMVA